MIKAQYKQFINEVYFLGTQKEYAGGVNNIISSLNILKSPKKILIERRKAYNSALADILKKYDVNVGNLWDDLEKAWEKIGELGMFKKFTFAIVPAIAINPDEIQTLFDYYIDKTRIYCDKIAKEQIHE